MIEAPTPPPPAEQPRDAFEDLMGSDPELRALDAIDQAVPSEAVTPHELSFPEAQDFVITAAEQNPDVPAALTAFIVLDNEARGVENPGQGVSREDGAYFLQDFAAKGRGPGELLSLMANREAQLASIPPEQSNRYLAKLRSEGDESHQQVIEYEAQRDPAQRREAYATLLHGLYGEQFDTDEYLDAIVAPAQEQTTAPDTTTEATPTPANQPQVGTTDTTTETKATSAAEDKANKDQDEPAKEAHTPSLEEQITAANEQNPYVNTAIDQAYQMLRAVRRQGHLRTPPAEAYRDLAAATTDRAAAAFLFEQVERNRNPQEDTIHRDVINAINKIPEAKRNDISKALLLESQAALDPAKRHAAYEAVLDMMHPLTEAQKNANQLSSAWQKAIEGLNDAQKAELGDRSAEFWGDTPDTTDDKLDTMPLPTYDDTLVNAANERNIPVGRMRRIARRIGRVLGRAADLGLDFAEAAMDTHGNPIRLGRLVLGGTVRRTGRGIARGARGTINGVSRGANWVGANTAAMREMYAAPAARVFDQEAQRMHAQAEAETDDVKSAKLERKAVKRQNKANRTHAKATLHRVRANKRHRRATGRPYYESK